MRSNAGGRWGHQNTTLSKHMQIILHVSPVFMGTGDYNLRHPPVDKLSEAAKFPGSPSG